MAGHRIQTETRGGVMCNLPCRCEGQGSTACASRRAQACAAAEKGNTVYTVWRSGGVSHGPVCVNSLSVSGCVRRVCRLAAEGKCPLAGRLSHDSVCCTLAPYAASSETGQPAAARGWRGCGTEEAEAHALLSVWLRCHAQQARAC